MIDQLVEKIIQSPLFLRLKAIIENNSYHDHEPVYSHLTKTKDTAIKEIKGEFITNSKAKEKFKQFVSEDFHGMKRSDIMILIALLHDIGKMLSVKDGDQLHPILDTNSSGITACPGHEYWGSTIVGEVLKDFSLNPEVIKYISNVVRLHDTFSEKYFTGKDGWSIEELVNDAKSRAEGLYKEAMFNQYCDCFTATPFQFGKDMIIKIFNEPSLYIIQNTKRQYVIS